MRSGFTLPGGLPLGAFSVPGTRSGHVRVTVCCREVPAMGTVPARACLELQSWPRCRTDVFSWVVPPSAWRL